MNTRLWFVVVLLTSGMLLATAQEMTGQTNGSGGRISGNLETTGNFYVRDSLIGAINTPQYDRQKYGADAWLNLNYSNWGFDLGLRFDMFQNSNLLNPTGSFTGQGIGRWYIRKKINKLGITGGYIYDVIGSGIIFRAYEERSLAIDQALYGLRLTYDLSADWQVKVFSGRQKQQFDTYKSIMRGVAIDGFISGDSSTITLAPGFGVISRALDDASMNSMVATLNTYRKEDIFIPKYNTYAFSFYNTLTTGPISWYAEGAYKTKDNFTDPFQERTTISGDTVTGRFVQGTGTVFYSSLSYAKNGLGITVEGKRTENFDFRTRPQEDGNRGLLHYIPPMTRVNTYRLLARYAAATQYVGELAFQADVQYRVNKKILLTANFSNITDLDDNQLYRELYTELYYKYKRKWTLYAGVQLQEYNQEIYQGKPGVAPVKTITPFFDFLYKIDRKKALRLEAQYMNVQEDHGVKADYGNWLHGLVEYTVAPHWTFSVSDMFNISPGKLSPENTSTGEKEKIHFRRFDVSYTHHANRFSLSYVKQPEGIVCSGGICRLEPAFNGVKLSVNSTF
ncbi:MAG: DUF6029 family protein [Saprospiraceae bacterium]